jgi:hypothetical protein
MMRKIVIGLATAALVTGASTLSASAHGGGGGGSGMHGGGGSGMGMHGGGRFTGSSRAYGFHGDRYRYRERFGHHPHERYGYRRYYRYGGYGGGSCWSPEGQWVCGYERPSYGYRYGRYRQSYGHRYGRR